MSYAIMTDTSANLPTPLLRAKGLRVVPFTYTVFGRDYQCLDTERFEAEGFYNAMRRGVEVQTSLVRPAQFEDAFRAVLEAGEDLLFVGMSSGISDSHQCAVLAAETMREAFPDRRIRLVDSLAASLGEGLLVLEALRLRDEGRSLDAAADELELLRKRICQVFTVDDLMFLRKGGRLSNAAAVVGTVLQIKPLLRGDEGGRIVSFAKVRGRKRSIEALAEQYEALADAPETQTVGIAHAGCPQDAAALRHLLLRARPPKRILTVDYEPVTGSHVGPGALALFFRGGEGARGWTRGKNSNDN